MAPRRESTVQALGPQTPVSELLAKVELFRNELGSMIPSELNITRYRSLINRLGLAARDIEEALQGSDTCGAPRNHFESRPKEELFEWSQLHFVKLRALRDELTSLIDSYKAELKATERGSHRNRVQFKSSKPQP